jgi:phosphoenolpyruvate carboxylase
MSSKPSLLPKYNDLVSQKFQLYNGLFLTLPFSGLIQSGNALPLFNEYCAQKLSEKVSPRQIVRRFFNEVLKIHEPESIKKILILFLQFVERQVVLFDALEDSAFNELHDIHGPGSLQYLLEKVNEANAESALHNILKKYRTRIVLTAHPTQFYPRYIITIIHQLSKALSQNNTHQIAEILLQLGKTSLTNSKAPSPLDEADFLLMQMRQSIYPGFRKMDFPIVELGFWPGGDRDGNPNVKAETTLETAKRLKNQILHIYQKEIDDLRNHLTFPGVWERLSKIATRLKSTRQAIRSTHNLATKPYHHVQELMSELEDIEILLNNAHGGLFIDRLQKVMRLISQFGFYFASLDMRQNAPAHGVVIDTLLRESDIETAYLTQSDENKMALILRILNQTEKFSMEKIQDADALDTLNGFKAILKIQRENGERGLHRYIISNSKSVVNIFEVFLLAKMAGLPIHKLPLDIVPLFESIEDLQNAESTMQSLWANPFYQKHLKRRAFQQTVMLGFSDGTKDGGYFAANWAIYQCKLHLAKLALKQHIEIIFFDGRGGPPARGGGNTHSFYQALESAFSQNQVQLTIQGQTISSNFGIPNSARFNTEQLATAALSEKLFPSESEPLSQTGEKMMNTLAEVSFKAYEKLKNHPLFLPYLSEVTPLEYYGELNITSRPARRKKSPAFSDLRAIPFVGAWSQMKQNVPGYFGLGTALQTLIETGHLEDLRHLYQNWLYFKTLINNAMMSLKKSNFSVTEYLRHDKKYGKFWTILSDEATLSEKTCLAISKQTELLESEPALEKSIQNRESIILPLLVLQQYALDELRNNEKNLSEEEIIFLKKLILKSLAANINAARNSV